MAICIRKQEVCIANGSIGTLHKTRNYLRTYSSSVLKNSKNQNINKFTIREKRGWSPRRYPIPTI